MKEILYNSNLNTYSQIFENGYNVPIPENEKEFIHVLKVIETEKPIIETNQWLSIEWITNLDEKTYEKKWIVNTKTPYEIACDDWGYMEFSLRIHAHKSLARLYPNIYAWFQVNNYPIASSGDMRLLYCNSIHDDDVEIIANNNLFVEDRPKPEDFF